MAAGGGVTVVLAASAAADLALHLGDGAEARANVLAYFLGMRPSSCAAVGVRRLNDASAQIHAAGHGAAKALVAAASAEAIIR